MPIPAVRDYLPDVWDLVASLRAGVTTGAVTGVDEFVERCRVFFTPEQIAVVDAAVPGWARMASYADGKTLWHVMVALVALLDLDEYHSSDGDLRRALEWAVLLHDLAKEPAQGRDHRHAVRSAAAAGRVLAEHGLAKNSLPTVAFEEWFRLANTAYRHDPVLGADVQDNDKMAALLTGARHLFPSPAFEIVASIALHLSLTVLADWPVPAPLPRDQLQALLEPELQAILEPLMLADSGGWNLFDRPTLTAMYGETRAVFRDLSLPKAAD